MKDMRFLKVFASYLILILLTVGVLDFFLTPKINQMITKSIEDEMIGIAKTMALVPAVQMESKVLEIARQMNVRVTLMDHTGLVLSDTGADSKKMENHLNRPEIEQARMEGVGKASRFSVTLRESMLYVAVPIKENSDIKGYIRLARPLSKVTEALDHLSQVLYLTLYIIAIPSLVLAFVFSRKITSWMDR